MAEWQKLKLKFNCLNTKSISDEGGNDNYNDNEDHDSKNEFKINQKASILTGK